jgi:iron-sulfur cluster repair protein YtfE (RIC family)
VNAKMDLDIVELLIDEHEDIREKFREVRDAEPQARSGPFEALVERLASHEAAEEALVHRTMRAEAGTEDEAAVVGEILEEEASAERRLAAMAELDPSTDGFMSQLDELEQEVLAHAEHEERDEFPAIRRRLGSQRRHELAERFQRLRQAGPTRPHPETPQEPHVRAALGPIVGVFDRARDQVRKTLSD